jgi:hypothetical protein
LVQSDAEYSDSDSSSSDDSNDHKNGMLLHMNIWLGPERGHQPLVGLATDKPAVLAKNFCKKHRLSINA